MAILCISFVHSYQALARGIIVYGNGEELTTLEKLPADFVNEEGEHYNFGVHYESFSLFWLPVWNYGDYKYALVNDAEDSWLELTVEEAKQLGKEMNFDVPDEPTLPLSVQIDLKPVVLILLLFSRYGAFSNLKKKVKGEPTEEEIIEEQERAE